MEQTYIHWVYNNIRHTFLILSCAPFSPQNSLNSSGHGLYNVSKVFNRDADPCWLQCLPQLCQVGSMSFGWWTILDTHGKLLSFKISSSIAIFDTFKSVSLTTIPCSMALKYFVLHIHTLNGTHNNVSIVSRLTNTSLTCLLPFIYTDWSRFNRWHQLGIIAFTWIHLVSQWRKEQVFLMFCTLSVYCALNIQTA